MCLVAVNTMNRSVGPSIVRNMALALFGGPAGGWLTQYTQLLGLIPCMDMSRFPSANCMVAELNSLTLADCKSGHLPLSEFFHLFVRKNVTRVSANESVRFNGFLSKQSISCTGYGRLLHSERVQRFDWVDGSTTICTFATPALSRYALASIIPTGTLDAATVAVAVRKTVRAIRRAFAAFSTSCFVDPAGAGPATWTCVVANEDSRLIFTASEVTIGIGCEVDEHGQKVGLGLWEAVPPELNRKEPPGGHSSPTSRRNVIMQSNIEKEGREPFKGAVRDTRGLVQILKFPAAKGQC